MGTIKQISGEDAADSYGQDMCVVRYFTITIGKSSTKLLKEAGYNNPWFRIDILNKSAGNSVVRYICIAFRNIKNEEAEKAESEYKEAHKVVVKLEDVQKGIREYSHRYGGSYDHPDLSSAQAKAMYLESCIKNNGNLDQFVNYATLEVIETWLGMVDTESGLDEIYKTNCANGINALNRVWGYKRGFTSKEELKKQLDELSIKAYEEFEGLKDKIEAAKEEKESKYEEWRDFAPEVREMIGNFVDALTDMNYYTSTIGKLSSEDESKLANKVSIILTVITNVGIIISVLMSAIIGVKYMVGSVEEKAEYKKDMIPYLIGAILLFGICTIVKMMQSIGDTINKI